MNPDVFEKYRTKRKMSKQDVAAGVGKTPGWYSKLIKGEIPLRTQYIAPMAETLGISTERLTKEYFSNPKLEDTSSFANRTA